MDKVDPDRTQLPGAFANDWRVDEYGQHELNYCFPPFSLLPRVLAHIRECAAVAVVVVPWWPSQVWWVDAMSMVVRVVPLPMPCFQYVKNGQMVCGGQDAFLGGSAGAGWEGRHELSDVVRDFGLTPASFYVKKKAKGHNNQIPMQLH